MEPSRLKKDVFVSLAAIAWADGKLDPDEADAIVRAAADEGLSLEEIAQVEASTVAYRSKPPEQTSDARTPPIATLLDRTNMTKEERIFVYAVACWIARIDGDVSAGESDALRALGERLGVPDRIRARAEHLAKEVAELPEGDRPLRYDLATLRRLIGERLAGVGGARPGT
jgi:tellurite resistance protein